ncbi:hypothetical protein DYB38_011475 [Aphanomyces astaci]|uniref:DUF7769 domain-containing protein n=3 Tax=Aphanomyces astaci TaxID=112090 RepID=A0A397CBB2_APHAT|nr:hypothetical protein DYB38_011475 [Aphanomyces astaci]
MRAKKDLTKTDREAILQQLMAHLVDSKKLIRGALNKIALDFGVHRGTVQRVWKRANVDLDNTLRPCSDISSRKKNSGRNLKHANVADRLRAIPKGRRATFRSIAAAMGISRTTLHRYYRRGIFTKYTSSVRPALTAANKVTLNNNFLTLQGCMRETICAQGSNAYKIPHIGKAKLMARGMLPEVLVVDRDVVELGFQQLDESDVSAKFEELAVEVSEAMEMCDFSSQLEKLIVNDELEEDPGVELGDLLDLTHLF